MGFVGRLARRHVIRRHLPREFVNAASVAKLKSQSCAAWALLGFEPGASVD